MTQTLYLCKMNLYKTPKMYGRLKTISLALVMTAVSVCTNGQELKLSANDIIVKPGSTKMMAVKGYNPSFITGWQMTVQLPEGIEMESGDVILNDRYPWKQYSQDFAHNTDITKVEGTGNDYLITCYADKPAVIYGESGILVSLALRCSATYKGRHQGRISNIAVADFNTTPKQTNQDEDIVIQITDDKTASIEGVVADGDSVGSQPYVSLCGQKVEKPERKGIYIRNGHKVIVR